MTDHLDIVAVGVENKRSVVLPAVLRSQPGRAIILPTRIKGSTIESIDLLPVIGYKRNVKVRGLLLCLVQTQRRFTIRLIQLDTVRWPVGKCCDTNRLERLQVEVSTQRKIPNAKFYMVKHVCSLYCAIRAVVYNSISPLKL